MVNPQAGTTTRRTPEGMPAHPLAILGAELQRALDRHLTDDGRGRRHPAPKACEVIR